MKFSIASHIKLFNNNYNLSYYCEIIIELIYCVQIREKDKFKLNKHVNKIG